MSQTGQQAEPGNTDMPPFIIGATEPWPILFEKRESLTWSSFGKYILQDIYFLVQIASVYNIIHLQCPNFEG